MPTVMADANPEQLERFVPAGAARRRNLVPVVSEPAAGSDLAGCEPARHGDARLINGQKTWTSGAHCSDFGMLVVRTDPRCRNIPV